MRRDVQVLTAILIGLCPATAMFAQEVLPEPTWVIPFDGSLDPTVAAGATEHPHLVRDGVGFTEGRNGQAVLIGDGPILIYQIHGNIPDQATLSFWINPSSDSGTFNRVIEKGLWGYNDSYYFGGGNGTNDLPTLLSHADAAMYAAKRAGRNKVKLYPDDSDS